MKFKTPIEVQAGISDGDPTNPLGQAGYLLSSDGSQVSWVSPGGLSAETAETIVQPIKANEALAKGDPVYIVGFNNGQNTNIVAKADSSDAAKMPVVGLADANYANNAFGTMTAFGSFNGAFDTTGGTENWAIGDIIFVKPGGGLTNVKPGGTDLIQNVAIVSRVNSQTGELEVIALGRTNDVPNLPVGRLFVGTSDNTSLTSDVVYIDDANDRVGIGTGSPNAKLDVSGDVLIDSGEYLSWGTAGATSIEGSTASNKLQFRTSSTDRMIINDTGVGIGRTNPAVPLDVEGKIRSNDDSSNDYFEIFCDGSGSGDSYIENTSNNIQIKSAYATSFSTSGSVAMFIDNNQNVGIGTTSPSHDLDIESTNPTLILTQSGAVNQANSGRILFAESPAYSQGHFEIKYDGAANRLRFNSPIDGSTNLLNIGRDGNVGIGTTSPALQSGGTGLHINATTNSEIKFTNSTTGTTASDGTALVASGSGFTINNREAGNLTLGTNNSTRVLINSIGKVGIGTTNPNQKLHVNGATQLGDINSPTSFGTVALKVVEGTIATGPTLGSGTVGAQAVLYSNGLFGMYTGVSGSGDTWMQSQRNDANTATYDILLNPAGGRVAIGHNNPVGWLDVFRTGTNYAVNLSDTLNRAGLVVKSSGAFDSKIAFSSGASSRQYIQAVNNAGNTGRDISINPYGGNVGIGTTIPYGKLDVAGDIRLQSDNQIYFGATGSIPYWTAGLDNTTNNNFVIGGVSYYSGDRDILLTPVNNGNVGIGTTSPSQLLHVAGNMRLQNQLYDSTNSLGTNGEVLTKVSAGTEWKVPAVNAQMPNNTAAASAANVGTIRYRSTSNTSFVDMSMQTGATTYAWVNIVSNFWF